MRFPTVISIFPVLFLWVVLSDAIDPPKRTESARRRPFGQLPTSLTPTQYKLTIQPYFPADGVTYPTEKNFTFDANVIILIDCLDHTENVTLNLRKITLNENETKLKIIQIDEDDNEEYVPVLDHVYNKQEEQVSIILGQVLEAGKSYELSLTYTGILDGDALAGLYPSSYVENGQTQWLVVTQFESTDARRVIPSFDEPFYKASFEITIINPTSMVALSNSIENDLQVVGDGWSKTTFEPTPKMSSYLVGMAVCNLAYKSAYTPDGKTLFRVWARPSFINKTDYAVSAGPKVLDYYSKYFGIPFPLKKQDMLAVPDFAAGAMENWGMITYRETCLLYDEKSSTASDRTAIDITIAHELSHQWFGNLVTMEWWDDLWLKEGFATYMSYLGADIISNGNYEDSAIVTDIVQDALSQDQTSTSHPIFMPVDTADEIEEIFDAISYKKGASVIRMLNYTVSSELLQRGLHIYLSNKTYENANHNDLWSALSQAVEENGNKLKDWSRQHPLDVIEFMNAWIMQMGYPVLNVKRTYGGLEKIATIDQERFLVTEGVNNVSTSQPSPYGYTWYVPVFYQTGDSFTVKSRWLQPHKTLTIDTADDRQWLLVNYERAAYCRVNYDEENWKLLTDQLQNDHTKIPLKNRIELLDDALKLARANRLSYKTALDLTLYLPKETEFLAWDTALNGFSYIRSMLASKSAMEAYKSYIASLTYPLYQQLNWEDPKNDIDNFNIRNLRAKIFEYQCWAGGAECKETAQKFFQLYIQACSAVDSISSHCTPIPAIFRSTVYCEGVKSNNTDNWRLIWLLHAKEQQPDEKRLLMQALACTDNPNLINRLLQEVITQEPTVIRRQDASRVFTSLGSNDRARPLLWPFIVQNWPIIQELYAGGAMLKLKDMLNMATDSFSTIQELATIISFANEHENELRVAKQSFKRQLEVVAANVIWMNNNGQLITNWLEQQPLPAPTRSQ